MCVQMALGMLPVAPLTARAMATVRWNEAHYRKTGETRYIANILDVGVMCYDHYHIDKETLQTLVFEARRIAYG